MKSLFLLKSNSVVMNLEARKYSVIEKVMRLDEHQLERIESTLNKEMEIDPVLQKKLTSRALKANEDIKEGRVYSRKEAEAKLQERMGI
jgi:hypothetical protein